MSMRSSALLLVVSLVSPAVVTAVCELTCLRAHHNTSGEAMAAQCHGQEASPAPVVTVSAADRALCHGDAPVPSASVKATPQFASMPAVVNGPRPAGLDEPAPASLRGRTWYGPPDFLLITTQLRI